MKANYAKAPNMYRNQAEHLVRKHPANKELMELERNCEYQMKVTGEVEYWYGERYAGSEGRIKAKPDTAKRNVHVFEREKDWKTYTVTLVGKDREHIDNRIEKWEGRWAIVRRYGDGTDQIKYVDVNFLGKPAHLEHYLKVIGGKKPVHFGASESGNVYCILNDTDKILFAFDTTGKPATEKDAKEYLKLVQNTK